MQNDYNQAYAGYRAPSMDMSVDQGLRSYMLGIYNYMAAALVFTGIVAFVVYSMAVTTNPANAVARVANGGVMLTQFGALIWTSPLKWVIALAPIGIALFISFRLHAISTATAQALYWVYAASIGASLSVIFVVYQLGSIAQVFFMTAAAFGALSLWGYTTKRDISGWSSFLFMGVIGILIASIVNIFLGSSALAFAISVITILVFAGLTAWDTQRLKSEYYEMQMYGGDAVAKSSIMGALSLYINFIMMFQAMLSLFGQRE